MNVLVKLLEESGDLEMENKAWSQWVRLFPSMVLPSPLRKDGKPIIDFLPFSQFLERSKQPVSYRPAEDIINEAERIEQKIRGKTA